MPSIGMYTKEVQVLAMARELAGRRGTRMTDAMGRALSGELEQLLELQGDLYADNRLPV